MLSQFDYLIESPAGALFSYLFSSVALYVEHQLLGSSIKRSSGRGIITQLWHSCLALETSKCKKSTVIKFPGVAFDDLISRRGLNDRLKPITINLFFTAFRTLYPP